MPTYKTPGVYIEELPVTGPIAGVGTSTAAFLGPTLGGATNVPTKVTNWTQFKNIYGEYQAFPRLYLPHAVRGFFDNGGTVAYIVRVGTAARASREIDDRGAAPAGKALRVEAKREGADGNNITATVADAQIVAPGQNARVARAAAPFTNAAGTVIPLNNAADTALFRPGDVVTTGGGVRIPIDRIRPGPGELVLASPLAAPLANGTVRIANLVAGQKAFRLENSAGIEPGSVLRLVQAGGSAENLVVDALVNGAVTVAGVGLANGYDLDAAANVVAVTSFEFNLTISHPGPPAINEPFTNLSMDPRHTRYYPRVVTSQLVDVMPPAVPTIQVPPNNRPLVGAFPLLGGANDNPAAIGLNHYKNGLAALESVDDVNIVCTPGRPVAGVQAEVIAHCEKMMDRFAVLDSDMGLPPFGANSVTSQRAALLSARGYAALYYPWIVINDPTSLTGADPLLVPPSGHLAGVYARSDQQRGVHKAPANEFITGAVDLERLLNDQENGELNVDGINCLRVFPGQRPIVWGARTTTPKDDVPWRYVNVRRLFLFIEESIKVGIRSSVFEPNDFGLWKRLDRTITDFLTRVWRSGALVGRVPEHAFRVKIDEELNPPSVQALGQVIIEIMIAPVKPAEFVIVRIAMWDGGSETTEA
jgi:phage tail sheath protein FI